MRRSWPAGSRCAGWPIRRARPRISRPWPRSRARRSPRRGRITGWRRAAAASGDAARAHREYATAAAYPSTYYGQLAALADGGDPARLDARIVATRDPSWDRGAGRRVRSGELARAAVWLVAWGEPGRAAAFLLRLGAICRPPREQALAARLATGFAMPQTAVALARLAGRSGLVLLDTGWPVAAQPAAGGTV